MKRILLLLLIALFVIACDDGGGSSKKDSDVTNDNDTVADEDVDEPTDDIDEINDSEGEVQPDEDADEPTGDIDEIPDTDTVPNFNVTDCGRTLPAVETGTCSVTKNSDALLIKGNVLAPDTVYKGGEVLVSADGIILCAGCDCSAETEAATATVVNCPDASVSPALINAHDHLGWTTQSPRDWGTERYEHRHDWRIGKNGHTKIDSGSSDYTANPLIWGELRNVMAGTTVMAGSGGTNGLLRNVEDERDAEGISTGMIEYETFPLGDSSGKTLTDSCAYSFKFDESVLKDTCFLPHVAEGINEEARNEFLCLSSTNNGGIDLTEPNSAFIHCVGLIAEDGEEMAENFTSVIWSPRSNISLYGNTAPVTMFHNEGVLIGMGTDWTPSGSINMLRELKCADELNTNNFGKFFTDKELWEMATINNAEALRISSSVGYIAKGKFADIAIFDGKNTSNYYRAVVDSNESKVALVLRGGVPLYGDKAVMDVIPYGQTQCEEIPDGVCEVAKVACIERETGVKWSALKAANASSYGLFFCGTPDDEPTCVPSRPTEYTGVPATDDKDGDGIKDDVDNCPTIFNPIRPLDETKQADKDNDGKGDACDPCPLSADDSCTPVDPSDEDGDGIKNIVDKCPFVSDPNQEDADGDGIGDACDMCPAIANPGNSECPAQEVSIYDIRQGNIMQSAKVIIEGVVTAVDTTGATKSFFMQVPEESRDAVLGAEYSAIYVYTKSLNIVPTVGNVISVEGVYTTYYGQDEITDPTVTPLNTVDQFPAPVVVTPAEIKTGGDKAAKYNSLLVKVENVDVTVAADSYNTFTVTGGLLVDDAMYAYSVPTPGTHFNQMTGNVFYSFDNSKLLPRNEAGFGLDRCANVVCDSAYQQCNADTGNCDAKEGFCNSNADCESAAPVCNTTSHICEAGDVCAGVTCETWETCNSIGECEASEGRCNTSSDCVAGQECDTANHNCIASSNLLTNGSFESWTDGKPNGWVGGATNSTFSQYTISAKEGTSAVQLINTSDKHKRFTTQDISMSAGDYTCSAWVRGSGQIRYGYTFGTTYKYESTVYRQVNSTDWSVITYAFNLTSSVSDFELIFSFLFTTDANDHIQIDNVVCTAASN